MSQIEYVDLVKKKKGIVSKTFKHLSQKHDLLEFWHVVLGSFEGFTTTPEAFFEDMNAGRMSWTPVSEQKTGFRALSQEMNWEHKLAKGHAIFANTSDFVNS